MGEHGAELLQGWALESTEGHQRAREKGGLLVVLWGACGLRPAGGKREVRMTRQLVERVEGVNAMRTTTTTTTIEAKA